MSTTILNDISWQTYECLLRDHENRSSPRFAYNNGVLEIMSPQIRHEETNRTLAALFERLAETWKIRYRNLGSTTFKRSDMDKGVEPDTCFYVNNLRKIAGKERINLAKGDPAPDLVIEVDVTSPSLEKLPIFAAFGVPEVWRVVENEVLILIRENGTYEERDKSLLLPTLTRDAINDFLTQHKTMDSLRWPRYVRSWARRNPPPKKPPMS